MNRVPGKRAGKAARGKGPAAVEIMTYKLEQFENNIVQV